VDPAVSWTQMGASSPSGTSEMDRTQLEQECARWRAMPFPEGSVADLLDEIHAKLAYVDAMVAETAIPLLDHGRYTSMPEQAFRELDEVLRDSTALEQDPADEVAQLATSYRKYAESLRVIAFGAQEVHGAG